MGFRFDNVALEDFTNKEIIFKKLIRGKMNFYIEPHNLDNGNKFQIAIYRDHERIKDIINQGLKLGMVSTINNELSLKNKGQIKLTINEEEFMIDCSDDTKIEILEYNFPKGLQDFSKGKIALIMTFYFTKTQTNNKVWSELKAYNNEEE